MSKLKFVFDPNQEHQLKAIESVVGLFEGTPLRDTRFQFVGDDAIANLAADELIEEDFLQANLRYTQEKNKLTPEMFLETDDGTMLDGVSINSWRYPKFTVEMETGTGKTYVYLRTIHELRKHYGFRKFIIVVPSIAIYEGTLKAFEITKEHFKTHYGNEVVHLTEYDGQQVSKLRSFANSSFTEILLITLDSFNKSSNIIFKSSEKLPGEKKPFQYIQETRPILILDESQNYLSEKAKSALRTLKPLCGICYSATPKEKLNTVYRLGPVEAFRQNLVKKIEVLGVTEEFNLNNPQLQLALESISEGYEIAAKINVLVNTGGKFSSKIISVKKGDNLFDKTKNEAHRGLIVSEIDRRKNEITFSNDTVLKVAEGKNTHSKTEVFRSQIEQTIRFHFVKQEQLKKQGIKVLSLFFIDRVDNYVTKEGIIRKIFNEAFDKLKTEYKHFSKLKAEEVHEGYFASKKSKAGVVEFFDIAIEEKDRKKEERELEKHAYELIMKNKERLLSMDEKVSFIFAHSALKEGWDNPNVFQICTLNNTTSESKKRQEIGRGLRLCVNQKGERVTDESINVLTVVANESYQSYVTNLQREYIEAGAVDVPPPSLAKPHHAKRNDKIYKGADFKEFWKQLCLRTTYKINIDSEQIIANAINQLNKITFPEPRISITKGTFVITEFVLELIEVKAKLAKIKISVSDTGGNSTNSQMWFNVGDELEKKIRDERLKGFKIVELTQDGNESEVVFGDKGILTMFNPIHFHTEKGQVKAKDESKHYSVSQSSYPVFNLIQRTSSETQLTRPTIIEIFKGIREVKKKNIFLNPEGFSEIFIREIKNILADHIADTIEYVLNDELEEYEMEEIFPKEKKYAQKELIEGTKSSLYDMVQIDSDVERMFVQNRLQEDDLKNNIELYFKFPNSFKIRLPKIIGNYVPDWGVVRFTDKDNKAKVKLVRETKGTIHLDQLQFPNESRKIKCAMKHFKALNLPYRSVDQTVEKWWNDAPK